MPVVALAIAVALVVSVSGCGSEPVDGTGSSRSDPPNTSPPGTEVTTSTSTTSTTAPPSPDELEVRAVIDRFWPAYLAALTTPTPSSPELEDLLTGEARLTVPGRIADMASQHQRVVPAEPSAFAHHVLTVTFPEPDRAEVRECLLDDSRLVQDVTANPGIAAGTIAIIDDEVVTSEVTTNLARGDDGWRITRRQSTERLQGPRDCGIFSP